MSSRSPDAATVERKPVFRLPLGVTIEYVGGSRPYYWIGDRQGNFLDAVDARDLRAFVHAPKKWAEDHDSWGAPLR